MAVLLLGMAGAASQTGQSPASPSPGAAPHAGSPSTAQAPAQPAGPAGPQINIAEITARANGDVGDDIQTTITGWQREFDRLESDLKKHACVIRSSTTFAMSYSASVPAIEDFWNRLEPPLAAVKAQVDLLGPGAGRRSTTRARTCCPQPGRAQLSLRAAIRRPGCGPLRQSADRPGPRRHPGHSPKELYQQPVPARPRHLLVPDLGEGAGLRTLGDEPGSRPRGRLVGRCPRPG